MSVRRNLALLIAFSTLFCANKELAGKTLVFAQAADGAGISLLISISNFSNRTATGTLSSFSSLGSPQTLPFSNGSSSELALSLPPNGTSVFTTTGTSNPAKVGFIQINVDQEDVAAVEIFRLGAVAEAAVLPVPLGKAFGLFVEKSPTMDTGIAVVRNTAHPVILSLFTLEGSLVATNQYDFTGLQKAQSLSEIFALPQNFRGVLRLESPGDFTGTGLRFGPGILSPLPFVPVSPTLPAPVLTSISPLSAVQGQNISNFTANGTNFQSAATLSFSGAGITVNSYSSRTPTQIVANITISAAAATGVRNVTVTNPDAQASVLSNAFTVTSQSGPAITSVSPTSGTQGQTLSNFTVNGTNFQSTLSFSGSGITVNSYSSRTATQIVANITISSTAATGARNVTVTNPDGQSAVLNNGFTVNAAPPAPSITGFTPASGTVGLSILDFTVTGINFQTGSVLSFSGSGILVVGYNSRSSTEIEAFITIADNATGEPRTVTVTNPDGQRANAPGGFTVGLIKPEGQIRAEQLYGSWTFNFSGQALQYIFFLVFQGSTGQYFVGGLDNNNNVVIGLATATQYAVLDDNHPDFDRFYVFTFTGPNSVSGCYYQPAKNASSLGTCFPMTGTRTPLTKWEPAAQSGLGSADDFASFVAVMKLRNAASILQRRSEFIP